MKKVIVFIVFFFFSTVEAFDVSVDMGSGFYFTDSDGELIYEKDFLEGSTGTMDHNYAGTLYFWAEVVPDKEWFPTLYLEAAQLKTDGSSLVNITTQNDFINELIDIVEGNFDITQGLQSRLTQTNLEGYLFYEYFKERNFPSLGMGIGIKKFDFDYSITAIEGVQVNYTGNDSVPLLFFKSRYLLDKKSNGSSIAFEADGKVYVFGDSDIYEYRIKTDFMTKYNKETNVGLEIGFKETYMNIKGDDIDELGGYIKTSGAYLGLVAHFK